MRTSEQVGLAIESNLSRGKEVRHAITNVHREDLSNFTLCHSRLSHSSTQTLAKLLCSVPAWASRVIPEDENAHRKYVLGGALMFLVSLLLIYNFCFRTV